MVSGSGSGSANTGAAAVSVSAASLATHRKFVPPMRATELRQMNEPSEPTVAACALAEVAVGPLNSCHRGC